MPKYPDKDIDAPAPTKGRRRDLAALKDRLRDNITFDGAERRYRVPPEDAGAVFDAGAEWARDTGTPLKAAITMAWRCYWELHDERT